MLAASPSSTSSSPRPWTSSPADAGRRGTAALPALRLPPSAAILSLSAHIGPQGWSQKAGRKRLVVRRGAHVVSGASRLILARFLAGHRSADAPHDRQR